MITKKIYNEPILIADDMEINLMLLKSYVQKKFSKVHTAVNGVEAYDLSKEVKFGCIILDIQMPIINGLDATELIRKKADSLNKDTPILGITAASRVNYELLCLERGMNSVLYKPITREAVLEELDLCMTGYLTANQSKESNILEQNNNLPFNYDQALEEFAGDSELLSLALTQFSGDLIDQMVQMEKAIQLDDYNLVRKLAHKIRGAAANITALPISEVAGLIEENEDSSISENFSNHLFLLKQRKDEFIKKIKQYNIEIRGRVL